MATNLSLGTLFTADVNQFLQGIGQIKQAVQSLQQTFSQAGQGANAMGTGLASAINKTTVAINKQNTAVKASTQQLSGLAGMWQRVQQAMSTSLAYGTAGAAIYAVIDGLKAGVNAIAEYDQALKNLQAITQASDAEMIGLADTIKAVSSKYIFSTKEIADGAVLMGQAGFTATQTMQALDAAAKLSMGTLEDMALTVDLVTTAIVSYNMSSVQAERVADVMANAMNRSKLTLDKLRVSFNYVGASAHEAGITLEETAAAMSVLANSGMRASTIGTALRQVLQNMIAPGKRLREEFQSMGIELSQLDPKVVGFSGVVLNLNRILVNQKTGIVDMAKAYQLFGLRGAQAAAILARTATDEYPRMLAMMYEVGSATTMADKQMEGLIAQFKNLAANAQLIAIALGEGGLISIFKMVVDVLGMLVKGVKNFLESGAGKFVSSIVAWSAAAAGFIIIGKAMTAFLVGSLIPGLIAYGKAIMDVVWAMSVLQGVSVVDKINMLLSTLTKGYPIFLAYAVIAGTIAAALIYWKNAQERQVETLTRASNTYKTAADTLEAYAEVLESLKKRQAMGQDVTVEYESVVKRLIRAYPQLKGVIDPAVESLQKNIDKINTLKGLALDKELETQIELFRNYSEQIKATNLEDFTNVWKDLKTGISGVDSSLVMTDQSFYELQSTLGKTNTSLNDVVDGFISAADSSKSMGEEAEATRKKMEKLDQSLVSIAKIYQKQGFSTDDIIMKMRANFNATEAQIKMISGALKSFKDDISEEAAAIAAAMANMPHAFTPFFDSLDAMSKVSFAKALKSMEDEVSNYQKIAKTILKTEEDRYAAEAFIRTKGLMKFADDVMKEKMTGEQLIKFKQSLIEKEKELVQADIDKRLRLITEQYKFEMEKAGENEKKKATAQEKYQSALLELRKKGAQAVVAIEEGANAQVVEIYKKTAEEVQKSAQKMASDYVTELNKMITDAQTKLAKLKKDAASKDQDYADKIRKIKQTGMTDSQKFSDDETRLNEYLNLARENNDQKYYDKASDLAESLARDVKDANGNIMRSEKENADTAIRYLNQIREESAALFKKEIDYQKTTLADAQSQLADLKQTLADFGGEWDKINDQKLKKFIDLINEAATALDRLSIKPGSLQEKTAAGKGEEVQKTPFTTGSEDAWKQITEKLLRLPIPSQPSYGAQPGVSAVQKVGGEGTINGIDINKLAGTGGSITVGGKTFNVDQLKEYEGQIKDMSGRILAEVEKTQGNVIKTAEDTGKQAVVTIDDTGKQIVESVGKAGETVEKSLGTTVDQTNSSITNTVEKVAGVSTAATDANDKFGQLGDTVGGVKDKATELRDTVIDILNKPINELITQAALDILENVKSTVDDIKKAWDSLKSKSITLTVNQVGASIGGGSGSSTGDGSGDSSGGDWGSVGEIGGSGGMSDWGGGETSSHDENRWGGLVGAMKSIATFASKGLKLPGYGGGDRVPVMAEAGEFIVNKESTSKFRPLIEAINNDTVADFGKRFGGVIKGLPAFRSGGSVRPILQRMRKGVPSGAMQPLHIYIQPKYMTGDKASAHKMAIEISKALEDLKKGRGYSNV